MPAAYIGRLAPSPTGLLHLGHAATFWTAFTLARAHHGTLLLRNEEPRPSSLPQRIRRRHARRLNVARHGVDLAHHHPIRTPAPLPHRPRPSPRNRSHLSLHLLPSRSLPNGPRAPRHRRARLSRHLSPVTSPTRPALPAPHQLPLPSPRCRDHSLTDLNLGPQAFTSATDFGDFLVWRKDGVPSYQLACAVDDAATHITEVVRGRDLLKSTARQILLQRALDLPTPNYFHTQLITDEHGTRLAKRHDALAIRTLRERGLAPAEVIAMFSSPR